jgi:uncharacterized membrane protein
MLNFISGIFEIILELAFIRCYQTTARIIVSVAIFPANLFITLINQRDLGYKMVLFTTIATANCIGSFGLLLYLYKLNDGLLYFQMNGF